MTSLSMGTEITLYLLCTVCGAQPPAESPRLDNNLNCVDLSDLNADLPLEVTRSIQILRQTEPWERSTWRSDTGRESVGYPTMVQNDRGPKSRRRYYLYYAHHDPNSGIGCAVADSIEGPYVKLAEKDPNRKDSRAPRPARQARTTLPLLQPLRGLERGRTTLVHVLPLYENQWKTGGGHQRTALATCPDLATNNWTTWRDEDEKLVPVLPVTAER